MIQIREFMKHMITWLLSMLASAVTWAVEIPPPNTLLWGFNLEGFPLEEKVLVELQNETQLMPQLVNFFLQWPAPGAQPQLITSSLEAIWQCGAAPCITWEPMYVLENKRYTIPVEQILDGAYSTYLEQFTEQIKAWKRPVIVRLGHEMNLQEYHWGTKEKYDADSPSIYIKLYRYLVTFCRDHGAKNILWAFCPNSESIPFASNSKWNCAKCYYPGDDVVDILGMDGYDWNNPERPFELIFGALYNELKVIAPNKPVIVFETSTASQGEARNRWILEAIAQAQRWRLNGIIWFQVNKEHAWQLGQPLGSALTAIKQASSPSQHWLENIVYNSQAQTSN